jgi:hypothetical protein
MANDTEKTAIANIGLLLIGESMITSLESSKPDAVKVNAIFESVVRELLAEDWYFSRKRVKFEDLVQVHKLTIDAAPTPAVWYVGGTITGGTSAVTCTVVEVLSDTVYLVTKPTGDWTDGETLSDGTNSRVNAAGYPEDTDSLEHGNWQYGFKRPSDILWLLKTSGSDCDRVNFPYYPEGSVIYTNQVDAFIRYNKWIGYQGSAIVSDVTQMRVWFHRLISARIAYILAPNVTENQRREQKIEVELNEAYLHAREKNGDESWYEDEDNNDWAYGANNTLNSVYDL